MKPLESREWQVPPPTPHCVGWDQSSSFQGTFRQLLLLSGDSQAHLQSGIWWIRHRYTCPGTPFPVEEGTSCWDRDTGKCKRLKLVQSTSPDTRSVFICHLLYKSNFFFYTKVILKTKFTQNYWISAEGFTTKWWIYMVNLRPQAFNAQPNRTFSNNSFTRGQNRLRTCFKICDKDKITNASLHCEADKRKRLSSGLAHYFAESETVKSSKNI